MDTIIERILKNVLYSSLDFASKSARLSAFVPVGIEPFCDVRKKMPFEGMRVVFDVGANVGKSSVRFARLLPNAQIHAFEPVQATFDRLCSNTSRLRNVRRHNLALGAENRALKISLEEDTAVNSLGNEVKTGASPRSVESITVATLDQFCADYGIGHIDYLKVDTEGFDLDVLKGGASIIENGKIDFIQVETGMNRANAKHVQFADFFDWLGDRSYSLFGLYHQTLEWSGQPRMRFCDAVFITNALANRSSGRPQQRNVIKP